MAIKIKFVSDVVDFIRGTQKAEEGVEDVEDSLKDVARTGDRAEEQLRQNFRRIETDADRAADQVKKGFNEVGDEAGSTAREAAASWDGSAESIGEAFQEVAANAFAGFGPAGAIAGLAAAAGIGLAAAGFEASAEAQRLSEERVAEWADAFIEAGGKALTAGVMAARAQEIITSPELFKEAETNAKNWGVAIETAIGAMTGNTGAIKDVEVALTGQKDAAADAATEAQRLAQESGGQLINLTLQEQAYLAGAESLGKLTGEMEAGQKRAQILNGYYENLINTTAGVTVEVDELGNKLYTLPDETQVFVDAQTGQASQNVDTFKGDLDGIPDSVTVPVKMTVDDRAVRDWKPPLKYGPVQYDPRLGPITGGVWDR